MRAGVVEGAHAVAVAKERDGVAVQLYAVGATGPELAGQSDGVPVRKHLHPWASAMASAVASACRAMSCSAPVSGLRYPRKNSPAARAAPAASSRG